MHKPVKQFKGGMREAWGREGGEGIQRRGRLARGGREERTSRGEEDDGQKEEGGRMEVTLEPKTASSRAPLAAEDQL